jgi:hypothetical protein
MAKYYPRRFAIAEGRKLVHRDMGGGLRFNAIGHFAQSPVYGMHPSQTLQVPKLSGPGFGNVGGYTGPPDANTPPGAMMMAMQPQQQARGGEVDGDALARATALLHRCKREVGGQVVARASGGKASYFSTEVKRLLALWQQTERQNPNLTSSHVLSIMSQKSPGVARLFKLMLEQGYSRDGIASMIRGGLVRCANE